MTKAAEEGSKETYRSPSARAGRTRQKFFHLHRNAVAAHYDSALGHRHVVGEDADLVFLNRVR
jgi:hypothetical protein